MKANDPLKKDSESFRIPMDDNAMNVAFDMAAFSFALNHNLPLPAKESVVEVPKPPEREVQCEPVRKAPPPASIPSQKDFENCPRPNPAMIYPPPVPFDNDPDRLRLLHAWYWAGYYTGLADGKNSQLKKEQ